VTRTNASSLKVVGRASKYAQAFTSIASTLIFSSPSQVIQNGALSTLPVLCMYMYGSSSFRQSIMDHNGGSVIAMAGKDCVAIASDLRLGAGAMTVALNFEKASHCSSLPHDIPDNACTYESRSFLYPTGYIWDSLALPRISPHCMLLLLLLHNGILYS
jgi:hypothetical protein